MVEVPVREHGDVNSAKIHTQSLDVVFETIGAITRVKENGFAVVVDKSGKAPVKDSATLLVPESVVEIQNRVLNAGR